jgi:integrase
MSAGQAPRLVLYRGTWAVYFQRRRISTGETERQKAERFLADFLDDLSKPAKAEGVTVAAVLSSYLVNRQERNRPGVERLTWAHKPLVRHLGERQADSLTESDFLSYAKERESDGVAASTVRTELQALRAALRWHMGAAAPRVWMPDRPASRDRWLTEAESDRLLAACERRHVRLFILLALHTAARAGSILALTWDRVDLDNRRIDYREPGRAQTRKRRVPVPINDTLLAELVEAKARRETNFVIEWAGSRLKSIKHGIRDTSTRARVEGVTPHVFRHSAATRMAQAGVPLWQIAGMLGHSDANMIAQVYGHHSPDHLEEASRALEKKKQCPVDPMNTESRKL